MVAIGLNNLGNAERGTSATLDAAREHYAASLRAYEAYDDRWALAHLLEDIGRLAAVSGRAADAIRLDGAALSLRDEIGAPRPPALDKELATAYDGVRATLGDDAERIANEARTWTLGEATAHARGICGE